MRRWYWNRFQISNRKPTLIALHPPRRRLIKDRERDPMMGEWKNFGEERIFYWRIFEMRKNPHTTPASARFFEQNATALHNETMSLSKAHGGGFGFFNRESIWILRATESSHRTTRATRLARQTNECAEVDQRRIMIARAASWDECRSSPPQFIATIARIDWCLQICQAGEHARNVRLNNGHRPVEGECRDRAGGIFADAWKCGDEFEIRWKFAAELTSNGFCRSVQISGARVIAETLPRVKHLGLGCFRQSGEIRKSQKPSFVVRKHHRDLRLLKHEF